MNCLLKDNLLHDNENYGISLLNDYKSILYHNSFVDNNQNGNSQAFCEGVNSTWYDVNSKQGNYWSDWSSSGSYLVDGNATCKDLYPLDEITVPLTEDLEKTNYNFLMLIPIVFVILIRKYMFKRNEKRN